MRSLMRAQLRLACSVVLRRSRCSLGGLPLLFLAVPAVRADLHVLGLPLPWLLLGVARLPRAASWPAWLYVRQAERNERDFADLVE